MPCLLKTYTVLGTSIVIRILLLILKRKQILFIKPNLSSQLLFTEHKVTHVLNINANSDAVNFNFTVTLCAVHSLHKHMALHATLSDPLCSYQSTEIETIDNYYY